LDLANCTGVQSQPKLAMAASVRSNGFGQGAPFPHQAH